MVLINELIGNFGKYHYWLCFLIFMSKFGVAYHQMAIIFLAPPPHYQCPRNETCCDDPIYDLSVFTKTIVTEWNLICENIWLKDLTQMLFQFGVLMGSFIFGVASDKYGRKPTLIIAVVLEVFTGLISSFLPDFWSFTIIRMFLGVAVGGIMVIGFVMVMEYVGNESRDVVSALYHVPFTIGHMTLAVFGYFIRDYMYFQLAISLSCIFLLIYICVLPETPRWLLATGKTFDAIILTTKIAKINNLPTEEIQRKIELYQMEHFSKRQNKATVLDLFRAPNLRRNILIMSFTWFVSGYCYYGISHYISHLTGDIFINVIASGGVCLCSCIIVIPLMKFMTRKSMVVIGNILCSISLLIIAFVPEGKVSVVLGCFGVLFCYITFIIVYLYCSEMFPTVVRNAAVGFTSVMARIGAMIAPFVADLRPYGQWCAPVAFGVLPLLAALFCLLLPETKDCELMMTIEEGETFSKEQRLKSQTFSRELSFIRRFTMTGN
ncbi:organic cation transporter protein-like [Manduca sexta]|uniref:organic cation transporter protein-like n=1 Tax=Manduca sexta TaxID=7130 RepID=UPI00188FD88D|nr:organic cation transporter protein-like [Manduca sexta]